MQSPGFCALTSAAVVTPLLFCLWGVTWRWCVTPQMRRTGTRTVHPANRGMWREYVNGPGSRGYLVFARWMKFSSLFPHFLSHICVTRLVKSLSLKLPRSTGHQSEELSNMRKSEGEMERRWEKLGWGWLQIVCLMAATQAAISGDLLSVMREADLPGSLSSLSSSVGHRCWRASGCHQWPPLLKPLCLQF